MRRSVLLLMFTAAACGGLERDYKAFLEAAKGPTEATGSTGSTGDAPPDGSTSTGLVDAASGGTGDADSGVSGAAGTSGGGSTTDLDATSGAASTTGGFTPFCGDGVVNQASEECDDGDLDSEDRCTILCRKVRLVFVTSTRMQGKLSGLQGADAYCKSLAFAAVQADPDSPIVDPGNFKALLSTSTQTIWDRHFVGKGPYRRVDGLLVSDGFAALFTAPLHNPINVDERGESMHANVWTGTAVDGSPFPGIDFCVDWTSLDGSNNYGNNDEIDSEWIYAANEYNPEFDCASERPIYCVEQE